SQAARQFRLHCSSGRAAAAISTAASTASCLVAEQVENFAGFGACESRRTAHHGARDPSFMVQFISAVHRFCLGHCTVCCTVVHHASSSRDGLLFNSSTCSSTLSKVSADCAPETPYLLSKRKNGTPLMPSMRAR